MIAHATASSIAQGLIFTITLIITSGYEANYGSSAKHGRTAPAWRGRHFADRHALWHRWLRITPRDRPPHLSFAPPQSKEADDHLDWFTKRSSAIWGASLRAKW